VTLPPVAPVPEDAVTVTVAVAVSGPLYPVALAVMVVVPAATAVTSPDALIVATPVLLEVQVTLLVMSRVER
jgi:hypothetical protein